jgi:hypothetical protein
VHSRRPLDLLVDRWLGHGFELGQALQPRLQLLVMA